jgi:hypothetical protein
MSTVKHGEVLHGNWYVTLKKIRALDCEYGAHSHRPHRTSTAQPGEAQPYCTNYHTDYCYATLYCRVTDLVTNGD